MKILFTGASSFTGHWFVIQLAERGHEVWATFTRGSAGEYGGSVRGLRVGRVLEKCRPVFGCRFGDEVFLKLLREQGFDLLCHHGADVTNYRSPDFDVAGAVANNTLRADQVLKLLHECGGSFLLTGTVFEPGEGRGTGGLPAISPYGVSKRQTAAVFERESRDADVRTGKFVISNPFGAWEDARFTTYLARTWSAGQVATVQTPDYLRDNIHVSLLRLAYVDFAGQLVSAGGSIKFNPSGYVESQRAFAQRVAREMGSRTGWVCELNLAKQTVFEEPMERSNTDVVDIEKLNWNESAAWDELADYYERMLATRS
jgi:nucleoside-diphosphate-sugar epimerase